MGDGSLFTLPGQSLSMDGAIQKSSPILWTDVVRKFGSLLGVAKQVEDVRCVLSGYSEFKVKC